MTYPIATEELYEIILSGEGQTVEFKESLAQGTQSEAIKAMVAFANGQGGRVFFGVKDNGRARGVHIGENTLERLANRIKDYTYPTLPVFIDDPFQYEGKTVLSVEVPKDIPPIIGVYLYSERPIPPDQPVDAQKLQAYRRVGRTNQKEDFMRLRQPQPSDPKLRVGATARGTYYANDQSLASLACPVWAEEGSPTAHGICVCLNPGQFVSSETGEDLPHPAIQGFSGHVRRRVESVPARKLLEVTEITCTYLDDWGIKWRVSRGIRITAAEHQGERWLNVEDRGLFTRGIVEFPPKVSAP